MSMQYQNQLLFEENEKLKKYRDLVRLIARDYIELSQEKAMWQRDDWHQRCKDLLKEIDG